jgi:general secretion pathway protein M
MNPSTWQVAWQQRSPREQAALLLAGLLVAFALLWTLVLKPALHSRQHTPAQLNSAREAAQTVLSLAQQARAYQASLAAALPRRAEALAHLAAFSKEWLGPTSVVQEGPAYIRVTLDQVDPAALAQWLQAVRVQARLQPQTAQLSRDPQTGGWLGELVLVGPSLQVP